MFNIRVILFLYFFCIYETIQMVVIPQESSNINEERKSILFTGWQFQSPSRNPYEIYYPRTDNYYFRIKPESIVEIVMDPNPMDDVPLGPSIVEHTSITTSINGPTEYKTSCVKEPGCRWECEPRQDDLPPDCDCVCFYTDAKWDKMP